MRNFAEFMNDEKSPKRPRATRAQRPLMLVGLPAEPLNAFEERERIETGTAEARNEVVIHAMRDACSYAQKICKGNVDGEDIFSACYDALCHAVANYRVGKKSFLVYAKPYIRGEVIKAWHAQKAVKKAFVVQMQNDDTDDDLLSDSNGEFDYASIHRREQLELIRKIADEHLSEQERLVMELRDFGSMTFIDIRNVLGSSRTNIQQIYHRAVKKIKKKVAVMQRMAHIKGV